MNWYLDTVLFHQCLCLFFYRGGLYGFAAFDPHRGLDSLGDFLVQAGADLHRSLPKVTRQRGEYRCCKLYQFRQLVRHGEGLRESRISLVLLFP